MRTGSLFIALLLLLMPASVIAQGTAEGALFDQVAALRLQVERLNDARTEIVRQRDTFSKNLDSLAARIEKHRQEHTGGGLLPDLALQQMLQQSQDLSGKLTLVNRELDALDHVRGEKLLALVSQYDRLVEELAGSLRAASGQKRESLVEALARIRRDRESLRKELNRQGSPGATMENEQLLKSEDPEELAERADAVRDEQDRLRQQLKQVDQRVAELQADRRLDTELHDFVQDQNLFGEEARTLHLGTTTPSSLNAQGGREKTSDSDPTDGFIGGGSYGAIPSTGGGGTNSPTTHEGRAPIQVDQGGQRPEDLDPTAELKKLSEQRQQTVERIKKLQVLYDRLREKSEAISDR